MNSAAKERGKEHTVIILSLLRWSSFLIAGEVKLINCEGTDSRIK